MLNLSQMMNL
ncbi:hypothetical protein E2C01_077665 [Portunus trituberculatus]|uniref:Uncharacterized protein n=1 Tax=Portunus trituberculatus TaxID=210409 RepID=A0A5B7IMX0_PORTR|nr:hypothetical protein [Portunus trituberculatus]